MFRKPVSLILIFVFAISFAQTEYKTENSIPYYPENVRKKDSYISSQCQLNFYYPTNVKNFPTIIWFHGGGLTSGNNELPKELLDENIAVVSVEYRLAPKVKAPAYIEDAAAATAWVFENIEKYGGNKNLIFQSGHSAGGYLAMMITLDKKYLQKYKIDADQIAGLIPFSGQAITHFQIRKEQGIPELQPTIDQYAPLFHVRKDAPPIVLITGDRELELLGRYEENAYLARMLKLVNHPSVKLLEEDGFDHVAMAKPGFPLLLKEVRELAKKIKTQKNLE
ncbi:alpha/beta hydrolase [Epilithonimonas zeae]|uniref:alpha/beta hydrolase n=1 Tax=Epilithonimonas zeae TaxID=1416779 RepID=UPI00200C430C|nr:alpha/beta hydrolase fold domain-containing protein [Epilithonimonas zeae]UQB68512.1 alpha/beta hydrolase fold domain-containing protein [Epilithonimonas zeae]